MKLLRWLRARTHGLQSRIVALFVGLLLAVQGIGLLLVSARIDGGARAALADSLHADERLLRRMLQHNAANLAAAARLLAADYGFREAVATGDADTLASALENHGARVQADVVIYADERFRLRASTVAGGERFVERLQRVAGATDAGDGMVLIDGQPYQLVSVAVRAPHVVGWVAMGFAIRPALLSDIAALGGLDLLLLTRVHADAAWSAGAGTLDESAAASLAFRWSAALSPVASSPAAVPAARVPAHGALLALPAAPGDAPRRVVVGQVSLARDGDAEARALLLRSYDAAVAPYRRLQSLLVVVALLALAVFVLGSIAFARRITLPLLALTASARQLSGGDYEHRAPEQERADEIGDLARGFESMRVAVRERDAEVRRLAHAAEAATVAKSQFLAAMSHEIRTPLNGVLGTNQLLLATPLDARQSAYARTIDVSGRALLALIDDILDLSRIEAGRMELECADFEPRRLAGEVVAALSARAHDKGLAIAARADADVPSTLRGDPRRLRQVLFNLLGNAVKFTARGEVCVELTQHRLPEGRCELTVTVRDTGIGIDAAQLPRLFERFVQGDNSTARRYGGSGLGLAITRQLVELMGGRIEVESSSGVGSVFRVTLALAVGDAAPREPSDFTPLGAGTAAASILVAEDNEVNQFVIEAMLLQLGHRMVMVGDGHEAVRRAAAEPFDLVLMDIHMPGLDGLGATRAIRALPGTPATVPIVALTASAMAGDRAAYLAAGMSDHVAKPVSLKALDQAIRRALAMRERAAAGAADAAIAAPT